MALDALVTEHASEVDDTPASPRKRRRRWIALLTALVLVAAAVGIIARDEVRTNAQYDRTNRALRITQARLGSVRADLDTVRQQLSGVGVQVFLVTKELAQDTADLTTAQTELVGARSDLSFQTSRINDLHTCLGGVQEALNALSVADQTGAVDALNSVAPSCMGAAAGSG